MKNLATAALVSIAVTAIAVSEAAAWGHCCGCNCCCYQYNAFSPCCNWCCNPCCGVPCCNPCCVGPYYSGLCHRNCCLAVYCPPCCCMPCCAPPPCPMPCCPYTPQCCPTPSYPPSCGQGCCYALPACGQPCCPSPCCEAPCFQPAMVCFVPNGNADRCHKHHRESCWARLCHRRMGCDEGYDNNYCGGYGYGYGYGNGSDNCDSGRSRKHRCCWWHRVRDERICCQPVFCFPIESCCDDCGAPPAGAPAKKSAPARGNAPDSRRGSGDDAPGATPDLGDN